MIEGFPIWSPNTGQVFDRWVPTPESEVESSVEAAHRNLHALADVATRRQLLQQCSREIEIRGPELVSLAVAEVGKKRKEAEDEVEYAVSFLRESESAIDELEAERRPGVGRSIVEVPYGPALLIAPFNDPLAGLTRKIGPAIAAGATVLVKPSRLGMLCARLLREAFENAGAGDYVRFVAPEGNETVRRLVTDLRVGAVSFTGSTRVGHELAVLAAKEGKKAILELGGNCPFVVCEDADLELALEDLLVRKLKFAGQACSSVNRVLVAAPRFAEFRDRLVERAARARLGRSDWPKTDLGPVRTRGAAEALCRLVKRAQESGEKLLTERPVPPASAQPFLFPFSILEGGERGVFDREESFGPALSLRPFDSLDGLMDELAGERHSLAAYFYTEKASSLTGRLRRLRFGSIGVNATGIQGGDVPTGGFWQAGIGREGGIWGVREYLATINFRVQPDREKSEE